MSQAVRVVQSTTREMAHKTCSLPPSVVTTLSIFNSIHRTWRWFRLGKIYSNPDNFLKLAAGHGLNFAFGNSLLLRISAVCVLIATRILECVEQQFAVQKSWNNLIDAFKGRLPAPVHIEWEVKSSQHLFSTSTVAWWKSQTNQLWEKIQWIAACIFQFCVEAFILSMRIADCVETFSLNPRIQSEGVNLLFVNGALWIERLVENKPMLIEGLLSNKKVIEKVLSGIHSPLTADQLIKTVTFTLEKTEQFHLATENVSKTVGVFLTSCIKKWGYEFMYGLGLHHLVPKSFVPSATPPWVVPKYKKITVRYPPEQLITKPSKLKRVQNTVYLSNIAPENSSASIDAASLIIADSLFEQNSKKAASKKKKHEAPWTLC